MSEDSEPMADDAIVQPQMKKSDEVSYENYFFSFLTFRVEGQVFRVPRTPFDESPAFLLKFNVPPPDPDWSDVMEPIDLYGVKKKDFFALLKILIPNGLSSKKVAKPVDLSNEEWKSVLALAHEWDFHEVLHLAKDKLKDKIIDPIEKIRLAQLYDIPEWLYSSLAVLVMRDAPLSEDEADVLGARLTIKLSNAREEFHKAKDSDPQSVQGNNLGKTVTKILVKVFGEDVRDYLKDDDKIFGGDKKSVVTGEVGGDDNRVMARAVTDCNASGIYDISLVRDQVVEVLDFRPTSEQWAWKVKTSDGRIGYAGGNLLFPLKKFYQYNARAKMPFTAGYYQGLSGQLNPRANQVMQVDRSFYPQWALLPARLNGAEGFVDGSGCQFGLFY